MVELRVRTEVCSPELAAGVVIPGNQCVKSNNNIFNNNNNSKLNPPNEEGLRLLS